MDDPVVIAILASAAVVLVFTLLARLWARWRDAARLARRRAELRSQQREGEARQAELERLASKIIATSSTSSIAGFQIVRQIEAVFTDGQPSQNQAVDVLKATAARKGANAIINLLSARQSSGKCVAQGDAVIVQAVERPSPAQPHVRGAAAPRSLPPLPPKPQSSRPPRQDSTGQPRNSGGVD